MLEHFLPVGTRFFWVAVVPAAHSASTHSAAMPATVTSAVAVTLFVGKQNGVDQGVGTLGGGDGIEQRFLAAAIDSVGENDDGLASLLFFHDFIRGQIDRIVEQSSAASATVRTASSA